MERRKAPAPHVHFIRQAQALDLTLRDVRQLVDDKAAAIRSDAARFGTSWLLRLKEVDAITENPRFKAEVTPNGRK